MPLIKNGSPNGISKGTSVLLLLMTRATTCSCSRMDEWLLQAQLTSPDNKMHAFVLQTDLSVLGAVFSQFHSDVDEEANCIQIVDENTFIISGTTYTSSSTSDIMLKKVTYYSQD